MAYTLLSGGTMVFVAQYFQLVDGLAPLQAAVLMAPGMAAAVVGYRSAARPHPRRLRPAVLLAGGLAVAAAGLLVLAQAEPSAGLAVPIAGFVLASLGGAPARQPGHQPGRRGRRRRERAAPPPGITQTGNECGYALGIAVLGSIGVLAYRAAIGDNVPAGARIAHRCPAGR